jgi:dynein heavy chain 1
VEDISDELEFLLDSGDGLSTAAPPHEQEQHPILTTEQAIRFRNFSRQSIFKPVTSHLSDHVDAWVNFLQSNNPEQYVPTPWDAGTRKYFHAA